MPKKKKLSFDEVVEILEGMGLAVNIGACDCNSSPWIEISHEDWYFENDSIGLCTNRDFER